MFKKLNIKHFKSYEKASILFDKGINVFVGSPQSGKTNILRAIRLLVENKPLGFKYVSKFLKDKETKKVEINLELDDGEITLEKWKQSAKSKYIIDSEEFDGEEFKGVGANVPEPVKNLLNLTELNFQPQLDMPFLITSSPGEIAKTINRITELDVADEWVLSLTKKINDKNKKIKFIREDIEKKENGLKKYKGIDKLEKDLVKIEKLKKEIEDKERIKYEIINLLEDITRIESKTIDKNVLENMFQTLSEAAHAVKNIKDKALYISNLKGVLNDISEIEISYSETKEAKEKEKRALVKIMKKFNVCPFCFGELKEKDMNRIIKQVEGM